GRHVKMIRIAARAEERMIDGVGAAGVDLMLQQRSLKHRRAVRDAIFIQSCGDQAAGESAELVRDVKFPVGRIERMKRELMKSVVVARARSGGQIEEHRVRPGQKVAPENASGLVVGRIRDDVLDDVKRVGVAGSLGDATWES